MLTSLAAHFGVMLSQNSDWEFLVSGNLDLLMDFRRAFDREIIMCGIDTAGSAAATGSAQSAFPSTAFEVYTSLSPDALTILGIQDYS